jgi:hypothetical protein
MHRPFNHALKLNLSLSRHWLTLGPGWAALAGALATGPGDFTLAWVWQWLGLWLLVDPILGMLWDLQGVWGQVPPPAQLPPPTARGFFLPYAQPGTPAGRLVVLGRRYQVWWQESYWPQFGGQLLSFGLGALLALAVAVALNPLLFWLTLLAMGMIILTGLKPLPLTLTPYPDLAAPDGGRVQAVVQFFIPWLMGSLLWSFPTTGGFALGVCYTVAYLGGLRMLGGHRRAEMLLFMGQVAAIFVLLAARSAAGSALLSVLLLTQGLIYSRNADFFPKIQPHLILGLLVAVGSL